MTTNEHIQAALESVAPHFQFPEKLLPQLEDLVNRAGIIREYESSYITQREMEKMILNCAKRLMPHG